MSSKHPNDDKTMDETSIETWVSKLFKIPEILSDEFVSLKSRLNFLYYSLVLASGTAIIANVLSIKTLMGE
jgi:hypothetical protein